LAGVGEKEGARQSHLTPLSVAEGEGGLEAGLLSADSRQVDWTLLLSPVSLEVAEPLDRSHL
jgi:hypothetical protein